ncbi:MAG: RluA family pseudouridine synthase [Spirochaetia bacterium]
MHGEREKLSNRILYEDNHIIAINKRSSEIVQSDSSGDPSLAQAVKGFIKARDGKPGNVFLGIPHRLDRPTSGVVIFAKTDKALGRLGKLFKEKGIQKVYWAVVDNMPPDEEGVLKHYLVRDRKKNKSFAHTREKPGSKRAELLYRIIAATDNYYLLEVYPKTGRHHQIRAQLAAAGCHIKGDLKYGARRSNPDAGIHLHAREVAFIHPVKKEEITISADPPPDVLWDQFSKNMLE